MLHRFIATDFKSAFNGSSALLFERKSLLTASSTLLSLRDFLHNALHNRIQKKTEGRNGSQAFFGLSGEDDRHLFLRINILQFRGFPKKSFKINKKYKKVCHSHTMLV
jgi:hypothetical protein